MRLTLLVLRASPSVFAAPLDVLECLEHRLFVDKLEQLVAADADQAAGQRTTLAVGVPVVPVASHGSRGLDLAPSVVDQKATRVGETCERDLVAHPVATEGTRESTQSPRLDVEQAGDVLLSRAATGMASKMESDGGNDHFSTQYGFLRATHHGDLRVHTVRATSPVRRRAGRRDWLDDTNARERRHM